MSHPNTPLVDQPARDLIRHHFDETLIVEAAAGTGKTTELVHRIVNVLQSGIATVDRIAAVTFTEKAAGELKLRLRAGLEQARLAASGAALGHIEDALAHLEEANVNTIHGFCAELLRERPVEAGVDPRFGVVAEHEARRMYADAFTLWLQEKLEDPPEGIRRSLRRRSGRPDEGPTDRIEQAGWTLANWRDFPAPWRRDPFPRRELIDRLVQRLHQCAESSSNPATAADRFYVDTWRGRRLSNDVRSAETGRHRDYDGLEAALVDLAHDRKFIKPRPGTGLKYGGGISRSEVQSAHRGLIAELQPFARAADADLAALLQHELLETIERYEERKASAGRLDFVDLLLCARNLIRECQPVRSDFQQRFTRIFVDEFQDTDPLQAEILLLLASDDPSVCDWRQVCPKPGKLFIVGDPKQSIYRFRRADVGMYQTVKELLARRGGRCLQLTTSFRAVPSLQNMINAAFAPLMTGNAETLQADYVPLAPHRPETDDRPTIVALPVPYPFSPWGRATGKAVEESLPDAVGAFIYWLLNESGWKVTERDRPAQPVPIAARHICLLFRRFISYQDDITRPYVLALETRGVPHLLVGGRSFHAREEIEAMRAALSAIEWPDAELSVFATLRGPLFAIDDEALLEYRSCFKRLHPFRLPEEALPSHLQPIKDALEILRVLHTRRNERPVADTIGRLLDTTRAHAGFVLRQSGEQVLANVLHLSELARSYEEAGGISFRGFVERLRADAEGSDTPEAPILEEGSDGVRLMTVHKAKGLEFPVVILTDITAQLTHAHASQYLDTSRQLCAVRIAGWSPTELIEHQQEELARDTAEGIRVAYVAATRARDLLVVPAVGDDPIPFRGRSGITAIPAPAMHWIDPLQSAVYPPADRRRRPNRAEACPSFGTDSVAERPDTGPAEDDNVGPGLHVFGGTTPADSYGVVWWDPRGLALHVPSSFGLRHRELIGKDAPEVVVETAVQTYRDWQARRKTAIDRGATPSVRLQTATERALVRADRGEPDVPVIELPIDVLRPAGTRYGTLVHAVLATVPLDASGAGIQEITRLHGRTFGATPEEMQAAAAVAEATLQHPLIERARAAMARGVCRREVPVTLRESDGTLVEGRLDLAFRDDNRWVVLDFKTDKELKRNLDVYRRQVRLYAEVVAQTTGERAEPMLLKI